jgi:hypothetical protein
VKGEMSEQTWMAKSKNENEPDDWEKFKKSSLVVPKNTKGEPS